MKSTTILITLCLTAGALAQAPTPVPKKDPFAGFGSSLDRKPTGKLPPAPAPVGNSATASATPALKLADNWDTLTPLTPRGPLGQRRELRALLQGFAEPGSDTSAHPEVAIYQQLKYLMPLLKAQDVFGLKGQINSGGDPSLAGIPTGLKFTAFSAIPARSFEVRFLFDRANQVVATEFVASDWRNLPPLPDRPADRKFSGKTYDFVPKGDNIRGALYAQAAWNEPDYVIVATRGGPKAADFYIPKPMVSLMLYCLDLQGDK